MHYEFDDLGRPVRVWQSHQNVVSLTTSPVVKYEYDTTAGTGSVFTNGARLSKLIYPGPNGQPWRQRPHRALLLWSRRHAGRPAAPGKCHPGRQQRHAGYGAGLLRLRGAGTPGPACIYPQPNVINSFHNGQIARDYTGLDRFGRIKQQQWKIDTTSGASLDWFSYTYDRAGNRLARDISSAVYPTNDKDQKYRVRRLASAGRL